MIDSFLPARRWILAFLPTQILLIMLLLTGCNSLGYYAQSVSGQWEVMSKRALIAEVINDEHASPGLRAKLMQVQTMRDFASREMALPDNDSYRSYADLQRPFVVWNVFAAPPYDMRLQDWCFPIAGCVTYRGYFKESAARDFAGQLSAQGLDTFVGGVAAYSTLGWFDDPLLNTLMNRSPARLAGLIFHELAHQQVYVKGDTAFNEAFATSVELEGVSRWLEQFGSAEDRLAYEQFQQRQLQFVELVTSTRNLLSAAYAAAPDDASKAARKRAVIEELREQYLALKQEWDGYTGYDNWFMEDINNAKLAAVTTYRDHVPAFQTLLAQQGGDLRAFYRACAELAKLPHTERRAALAKLSAPTLASR